MPEPLLKLPDGHAAQTPGVAPPQPLRYFPAKQGKGLQVEQNEAPKPIEDD